MLRYSFLFLKHQKSRFWAGLISLVLLIVVLLIATGVLYTHALGPYRFVNDSQADYWIARRGVGLYSPPFYDSTIMESLIADSSALAEVVPIQLTFAQLFVTSGVDNAQKVSLFSFLLEKLRLVPAAISIHSGKGVFDRQDFPALVLALDLRNIDFFDFSVSLSEQRNQESFVLVEVPDQTTSPLATVGPVGDNLRLNGEEFTTAGVFDARNYFGDLPMLVTDLAGGRKIAHTPMFSHILVKCRRAEDKLVVKTILQKYFPPQEIIEKGIYAREVFQTSLLTFMIRVMVVLSILILFTLAIIISITFYVLAVEQKKSYAMLKAFGVVNIKLYTLILTQLLIMQVVAFIIAVPTTELVIRALYHRESVWTLTPLNIVTSFLLTLVVAFLSAVPPVKSIARSDPLDAFTAK